MVGAGSHSVLRLLSAVKPILVLVDDGLSAGGSTKHGVQPT
jgi:hypothetical protein